MSLWTPTASELLKLDTILASLEGRRIGVLGLGVAGLMLYSGYGVARNAIDDLLGKPVDPETIDDIKSIAMQVAGILNVHDIVVHSYGGILTAIDGYNYNILWSHNFQNGFSWTAPSLGFLDNDMIPDVLAITQYSWHGYSTKVAISGSSGEIIWSENDLW